MQPTFIGERLYICKISLSSDHNFCWFIAILFESAIYNFGEIFIQIKKVGKVISSLPKFKHLKQETDYYEFDPSLLSYDSPCSGESTHLIYRMC